ncbi:hypothetical protein H310_02156 [Aphanomyces invadans]|uniref:Endonuclease/exonuclease/phosphatase domain-containing protein n=1 Tax=Aphanomyces invadans TaxID=157072 RepID=A0A024UPD0_9STRA|nr:hypothetical protein H310_02156 [Aphanomyces invadans]ETW07707.1 hypothetical protein H310_02156 [Aphanomyces invadans]|eukprot:XP_008863800.1 hypothetical protein H310_02156 [Aphanomyces invadans]
MQFAMADDGTHHVVDAPLPTAPITLNSRPATYRTSYGRRGSGGGRNRGGGSGGRGHAPSRAPDTVDIFSPIPDCGRVYTVYDMPSADGGDVSATTSPFRVVSFNVLADYLATSPDGNLGHSHPSQKWKFQWSFRCTRLLREMLAWNAAVICLQEVDHFDDFFEPELRKYGYIGKHKKRTGADTHDGCSIFIKEDLFEIVDEIEVDFHKPGHAILDRHNVALVLVLAFKPTKDVVVVATTHILFNPRRGDVKLAQLQLLLSTIQALNTPHVILCGDFNLTPKSALYEFLSKGALDGTTVSSCDASGQYAHRNSYFHNDVHPEEGNGIERHQGAGTAAYRFGATPSLQLRRRPSRAHECLGIRAVHELNLASAYAQHPTDATSGEPFATSYHDRFLGTVDYIWYANMVCVGVMELPPVSFFRGIRALPTRDLGSDHLSLVADFAFRS